MAIKTICDGCKKEESDRWFTLTAEETEEEDEEETHYCSKECFSRNA